jgi:hypothetical protein
MLKQSAELSHLGGVQSSKMEIFLLNMLSVYGTDFFDTSRIVRQEFIPQGQLNQHFNTYSATATGWLIMITS